VGVILWLWPLKEVIMSTKALNYLRSIWFRLRWLVMSERDRYAYLWNRTKTVTGVRPILSDRA